MARTLNIKVSSAEEATVQARRVLDAFEARYGVPSDRLMDVFLGPDGHVQETDEFFAWVEAWTEWQILTGQ